MKNFLKKHLGLIIYIIVSLVFCLLVSVSAAFLLVGCLMIGGLFIYFGVKVRKKYKEKVAEIEEQEELNYFDARKYDYDEDDKYVYQIKKINKNVKIFVDGVQAAGKIPIELENCEIDLWDMYRDYINGTREIAEINAAFVED